MVNTMQMATSRFGLVDIEAEDILLFPGGLIGYELQRHWVLLADADNDAVGWLQSLASPDLALAVISPRRFFSGHSIRVTSSELAPLQLGDEDQPYVLSIVSKTEAEGLAANLKAPIVINLDRHLGRQVVVTDDQPLCQPLGGDVTSLRKSA